MPQKVNKEIYGNICRNFIKNVKNNLLNEPSFDRQSTNDIMMILNNTLKGLISENKKKDKHMRTKAIKPAETKRRFKIDDSTSCKEFKGKNGKLLNIGIEKVSRRVRRINVKNWTTEATELFYNKYPNLVDTEEPKYTVKNVSKKQVSTEKVKKTSPIKKEKKEKKKNKKKKQKKSAIDLITSLVNSVYDNKDESKDTDVNKNIKVKEKKEISKTKSPQKTLNTLFQTPQKKHKKIKKKFKSKEKKIDSTKIPVEELKDFKNMFIDENNNIWDDTHKLVGNKDDDGNILKFET